MKKVLCNIYHQTRPQQNGAVTPAPSLTQAAALPHRDINRRNAKGDPWLQQGDQKHLIQQYRHSFITCHNLLTCPEDASWMIPAQKQPFSLPRPNHPHQSLLFIFCLLLILTLLAISKTRLSGGLSQPLGEYKQSRHFHITSREGGE